MINFFALGSADAEYQRGAYPDWFHSATGTLELATAALPVMRVMNLAHRAFATIRG